MHIVQLIPELNQGGVERGVVEFNRELVKRGHQSTVISAGGKYASQIEIDGGQHITLDICSKNPLTFFPRVQKLKALLLKLSPDILHARSRVPAWIAWFANKRLNIPFITTVHGFNSVSRYSKIMTKGNLVIYGSSAIKTFVTENYPVDPARLRYVPRGIDMAHFDPQKADRHFINEFKQKHQLNGRYVITIVGRITEWKGQDCFIRALATVQQKHPKVIGLVVGGVWHGKEDYLQSLKKLAHASHADICFAGSLSNVREIYALSNLIISAASSKPETFGRTAAEALAMNTPVIASAHGGSLDILLPEKNGFLFPPMDHAVLAEKITKALDFHFTNMREHIDKNFSLTHMTETELRVYDEITDR